MILMINPITKKIEKHGVPVKFTTELTGTITKKIKNKFINIYNTLGEKNYYGLNKEVTDERYSYHVSDQVSSDNIYNFDGELDEDYHLSYNCANMEFKQEAIETKKITINKNNASEFEFDYLLNQEIQNILDRSLYDIAVYDFLDKCILSDSSFQYKNDLMIRLLPENKAIFTISITGSYKKCKLINIPDGISVMINNVLYSKNNTNIVSGDNTICFINQSDSVLNIINPIILLGGE